jgi:hypothetical protein
MTELSAEQSPTGTSPATDGRTQLAPHPQAMRTAKGETRRQQAKALNGSAASPPRSLRPSAGKTRSGRGILR